MDDFTNSCFLVFFSHLGKKTSWVDPRLENLNRKKLEECDDDGTGFENFTFFNFDSVFKNWVLVIKFVTLRDICLLFCSKLQDGKKVSD